jgi:hypothetical protein
MHLGFKRFTTLGSTLRKAGVVGFSSAAFLAFAISAEAGVNLVTNGDFSGNTGYGQLNSTANGNNASGIASLTDWTNYGYNFVFNALNAGTGVTSQYGPNDLALWSSNVTCHLCGYSGPATGNDALIASPDGGNFVGADPSYQTGALKQAISGLIAGDQYTLTFYYAGAQQVGYDGPTTEGWDVSLGSNSFSTNPILNDTSHSFTGWQTFTDTFIYSGGDGVLSFLPVGGPNASVPPFALLDGVSLSQTPEPGYLSIGFGIMGLMLVMGIMKSRKRIKA